MQALGRQPRGAPDGAPFHCESRLPAWTTLYRLVRQHSASCIAHTEASTGAELARFIRDKFDAQSSFLDFASACATFNNHAGSMRSRDYMGEQNAAQTRIDSSDLAKASEAEPTSGEVIALPQRGGGTMHLRKLAANYDPIDRIAAMDQIQAPQARGEIVAGCCSSNRRRRTCRRR